MDPWQEASRGRQRKTIQSKTVSVSKISRKLYAYKCFMFCLECDWVLGCIDTSLRITDRRLKSACQSVRNRMMAASFQMIGTTSRK